jgi:hypothetical protein
MPPLFKRGRVKPDGHLAKREAIFGKIMFKQRDDVAIRFNLIES